MSDYCEVCESVAAAVSTTPATDVIMVKSDTANAVSYGVTGVTPRGITSSYATASDTTVIDVYAVLMNPAFASSGVEFSTVLSEFLGSVGRGTSTATQYIEELAEATASAKGAVMFADADQLLFSVADAISAAEGNSVSYAFVLNKSDAASAVVYGLEEMISDSADAQSLFAVMQRHASAAVDGTAAAASSVDASATPGTYLVIATAYGTSVIETNTEVNLFATSRADVSSGAWLTDPDAKAWVMNTESTAMSWYENFNFESIVSWLGREIAVGPDGIYQLVGDTDEGQKIKSNVESGFVDFGTEQTKRVDNMYFGYTSADTLSVTTEVYESGHSPATYLLERRDALAPRNSRVTPGKGLYGRYWRMTIRNVDGADFEVHDANVDIAISPRRV